MPALTALEFFLVANALIFDTDTSNEHTEVTSLPSCVFVCMYLPSIFHWEHRVVSILCLRFRHLRHHRDELDIAFII